MWAGNCRSSDYIAERNPSNLRRACPDPINLQKYISKSWRVFRPRKLTIHSPQIHHASTTNSPRFTIQKTPQFSQTPCKNGLSTTRNFFPRSQPEKIHLDLGHADSLFRPAAVHPAGIAQTPSPSGDQSYTLRTQSNIVFVPTTVQTKHGDILYGLKQNQFVVEDNGVPMTAHLDEDTDSLGLSLVVVVQCSRSAGWEFPKLAGLGTMIDDIAGDAPREVAIVTYGSAPLLLGKFSASLDSMASALSQLEPCDDPDASTLDAVDYAARLLEARQNHYRHAILLISETRDHGSTKKPAEVIAALGRTNTVVDSVAFGPGKTEALNDLKVWRRKRSARIAGDGS